MPKSVQSPGEFLQLLLEKHNLNPFSLSKEIYLSQSAVRLIAIGKTKISVSVAFRLAKFFNTSPEDWLLLQMRYDMLEAARDKKLAAVVKKISSVKKGGAVAKKAPVKKASGRKTTAQRGRKPAAAKKPARGRGRPKTTGRARKAR